MLDLLPALGQIEAQGQDVLVGHGQGLMENVIQLGTVVLLPQVADDGVHQLLLGFQRVSHVGQRIGVAVEPRGIVAVLIRLPAGAEAGQFGGGGHRPDAGQVISGHTRPPISRCYRSWRFPFLFLSCVPRSPARSRT